MPIFATPRRSVRNHLRGLALLLLTCALAGCGNTATNAARLANSDLQSKGSPFRWTTRNAGGGTIMSLTLIDLPQGPTKADAVLQADTLKLIARQEAAANRPEPQIGSVKHMKDGREVWLLQSSIEQGVAYIVRFTPTPATGGVDINLQGPNLYSK